MNSHKPFTRYVRGATINSFFIALRSRLIDGADWTQCARELRQYFTTMSGSPNAWQLERYVTSMVASREAPQHFATWWHDVRQATKEQERAAPTPVVQTTIAPLKPPVVEPPAADTPLTFSKNATTDGIFRVDGKKIPFRAGDTPEQIAASLQSALAPPVNTEWPVGPVMKTDFMDAAWLHFTETFPKSNIVRTFKIPALGSDIQRTRVSDLHGEHIVTILGWERDGDETFITIEKRGVPSRVMLKSLLSNYVLDHFQTSGPPRRRRKTSTAVPMTATSTTALATTTPTLTDDELELEVRARCTRDSGLATELGMDTCNVRRAIVRAVARGQLTVGTHPDGGVSVIPRKERGARGPSGTAYYLTEAGRRVMLLCLDKQRQADVNARVARGVHAAPAIDVNALVQTIATAVAAAVATSLPPILAGVMTPQLPRSAKQLELNGVHG